MTFTVTREDENVRLDLFLVKRLKGRVSRAHAQKLIEQGLVLLNGEKSKPHAKVKTGDCVNVEFEPTPKSLLEPQDIPVEIVYEDDDVIVVNKQPGIVVHPAPGNPKNTLVNALLYHTENLASLGLPLRPGVVHRLDKEVSGLLVFAKTDCAYLDLVRQFKERSVNRRYVALVRGTVELDEGEIELPLGRHPRNRKKIAVTFLKSKQAKTRYRVIKRFGDFTMVELALATGRTHQIRVHMAYLGHPILGDGKYGQRGGFSRIMLHARTLGFRHPGSKEYVEFQSELPAEMAELTRKF